MMKKPVNLSNYTKEELIWIIEYFVRWQGDFYLERAVADLKFRKEQKRIAEADHFSSIAYEAAMEANDLLKPYDGKPLSEVPLDVLDKVSDLTQKSQAAQKTYMKLMNQGRRKSNG